MFAVCWAVRRTLHVCRHPDSSAEVDFIDRETLWEPLDAPCPSVD
jgi:hypothetical protein